MNRGPDKALLKLIKPLQLLFPILLNSAMIQGSFPVIRFASLIRWLMQYLK